MPPLPRVGDQFGRYRIDSQIGRGGMGVVFGATDTTVGRTVALKVVSAGLGDPAATEEFRRRFEREAAVLARLDSPHVIAIYDYGTHAGCPYIATQFVGGGDLGALLHGRGPMPAALALRVCAQVADALHDAHRVGVVHRDVKPTNVLLRDADTLEPHALLCDFGIARTATDGLTAPGAVAGTWSYLSPECGRGAPGSPSSDIYALGCLVWASLTGAPPYRGSDVEIAVAHQRSPVPQLGLGDERSVRIDDILRRCLAKDPAQRYPSADQARVDLLAAAALADPGGSIVSALTPDRAPTQPPHLSLGSLPPYVASPTPTPTPRTRRRAHAAVALVCVGVVAIAGGVVAITQLGGDDVPSAGATPVPSTGTTGATGPSGKTGGPTTAPSTAPGPTRLDEGGAVRGDTDGDGIGDVTVDFYHSVPTGDDEFDSFTERTAFTSDGTGLREGRTVRVDVGDRTTYRQDVGGDFDGDGVLERLVLITYDDDRTRMRVTGDLSGGTRVDDEATKSEPTAFPVAADIDGDGGDDLVVQYYRSFEASPTRFAGIVVDGSTVADARTLTVVPYSNEQATFQIGDLDGNGYADLVVQRDVGDTADFDQRIELSTVLGGPDGSRPGPSVRFVESGSPTPLVGDVDGDEDDEVVLAAASLLGTLRVVDLRGERLRDPVGWGNLRAAGTLASVFGLVDVDGNGLDDVVALSEVSDREVRVRVALTQGDRFVEQGDWATWKRRFKTSRFFDDLEVIDQGFL